MCGHIHQPTIKSITVKSTGLTYLNSGDWIENLSALEYKQGEWSLYKFEEKEEVLDEELEFDIVDRSTKELFSMLSMEFQIVGMFPIFKQNLSLQRIGVKNQL